ncbi:hypothetical protein Aspvir_005984 [Aspergillus viridinutans]|uniref:AMP-dependent synthetase/ligase domain-containing protein n=1 Tax=Aspergillus viridinutans TaxID=75553 RepID=A0A9P3BT05_ASPVI|nr:uncharacterized protein Aspvir_005984 [Aspergillus viridinutans]GIK01943.1 hypothetical protein Aspvir_005984 [Aspergillus viridinutans]
MHSAPKRQILHNFDGVLRSGEMLMVLSQPGSGCSTFQKTVCGELHGLELHPDLVMHYNRIPMKKMHREFKGECVYNQEVDKYFPHLTINETLEFAALARTPSHQLVGESRKQYVKEITQVTMAVITLDMNICNISRPFPNTTALILDPDTMEELPSGSVGELCISGPQLARGYLNRPEATNKAFQGDNSKQRFYCTGDLARLLPNGEIELFGRKDDQVKINSH